MHSATYYDGAGNQTIMHPRIDHLERVKVSSIQYEELLQLVLKHSGHLPSQAKLNEDAPSLEDGMFHEYLRNQCLIEIKKCKRITAKHRKKRF